MSSADPTFDPHASQPATVAYAGEPGAFAEDAVLVTFGDVARSALPSFRAVFDTVTAGDAAAAVSAPESKPDREYSALLVEPVDRVDPLGVLVELRPLLAGRAGRHRRLPASSIWFWWRSPRARSDTVS